MGFFQSFSNKCSSTVSPDDVAPQDGAFATLVEAPAPTRHEPDFICRQAIYNRTKDVVGYELLFRQGSNPEANVTCAQTATGKLLSNSLFDIGFDKLVGNNLAFVNCSRDWILDERVRLLDKNCVVLEILEDVTPDEELIAAARQLAVEGYRIALDDFVYTDAHLPLVQLAHIIKLDVRTHTAASLQREIQNLRKVTNAQFLAEKVETVEEFESCYNAGFDLFQGYFLSAPRLIQNSPVPLNHLAVLQLLTRLRDPDISPKDVVELIRDDVTLSMRLMQFCNSSSIGLSRQIKSIDQAVCLLGIQRIRHMATLISLRSLNHVPAAVINMAMIRGSLCELIGQATKQDTQTCHMVGLFSSLTMLLEMPLDEVLKPLPLHPEVLEAILHQHGPFGELLRCVLAIERADLQDIHCPGLSLHDLQNLYLEAIHKQNLIAAAPTPSAA